MKRPPEEWLIEEKRFRPEKELLMETLFTLSNGYMAERGTLEEGRSYPEVKQYPGTYAAGVFDRYNKDYQAIVNLPGLFSTLLFIRDEPVNILKGRTENHIRTLDMYRGVLLRSFLFTDSRGGRTEFTVTRFISRSDLHLAVLHYRIKPLNYSGPLRIENILDGNVSNIDFHVSGYQLRDEKYYFISDDHEKGERGKNTPGPLAGEGAFLTVRTKKSGMSVCQAVCFEAREDGERIDPATGCRMDKLFISKHAAFEMREGREYVFLKAVSLFTSRDGVKDLSGAAFQNSLDALERGYESLLAAHAEKWERSWRAGDIRIAGAQRDQKSVRFNLFHLMQMGNKNDPRVNIGSRGLTSEMHYGNCFWDTEIFILPFFIYTDPDTARSLVKYRYLTLPEARKKARALWAQGAQYPWMSSYPGKEQADYWEYANIAIHIVSDVARGVMNYYTATGDRRFMERYGLEIMIETARFWASRVDTGDAAGKYVINTVKGPNEYDGVVNNNTYTNFSARWNLLEAARMTELVKKETPASFRRLARKLRLKTGEVRLWKRIAQGLFINYDRKKDLYIEDDIILSKRPVDIRKMKPGKKITTERGIAWDTILRHRVVKQADVLLMMLLHRRDFTLRQLRNAWKFYEPMTLHDSSLSYNTHSIIASELGYGKTAYDYFLKTSRLDIDDEMENTFLGIHAANAGGTWQCVLFGFCGMRADGPLMSFTPRLPDAWKSAAFRILFQKNLFYVQVLKDKVLIRHEKSFSRDRTAVVKGPVIRIIKGAVR